MIELTDAILAALVSGKIGVDEFFRQRNGKNGRNGMPALLRRVTSLETKVNALPAKIDALREGVRDDIRDERQTGDAAHRELHEKINACATGLGEVRGELKGLARGG